MISVVYNTFVYDRSPKTITFPEWVTESKCAKRTNNVIVKTRHGIVRKEIHKTL